MFHINISSKGNLPYKYSNVRLLIYGVSSSSILKKIAEIAKGVVFRLALCYALHAKKFIAITMLKINFVTIWSGFFWVHCV